MANSPAIGFVGFGEAAFHISKGLREAGVPPMAAYDINAHSAALGPRIQQRAQETGTMLVDSSVALTASSDLVISTVTANEAIHAAGQTAPFLTGRHVYVDLNSISPAAKQEI